MNFSQAALVLVGHGSTVNPDSSAPTHDHARVIRERGVFREVHCCFWKEEPSLREVWRMVESDVIYVVPNFISEGYFTQTVIPREMELTGPVTRRDGKTIYYCDPVGNHPRMTKALLRRAREVARFSATEGCRPLRRTRHTSVRPAACHLPLQGRT